MSAVLAEREPVIDLSAAPSLRPVWVPNAGPQTLLVTCPIWDVLYGGARGGGKGQPLDAPILTPFGFRPMGTMRVGSAVMAPDGSVAQVIGVYPLGERQLYRVTFHDGTSCEVTHDHIWLAWRSNTSSKRNGQRNSGEAAARLWTTEQMLPLVGNRQRFLIPVTEAVPFTDVARYPRRPVPAYAMGVLLGDGSLSAAGVTFCSADPEVGARVGELLGDQLTPSRQERGTLQSWRVRSGSAAYAYLKRAGMLGLTSATKYIPPAYLLGSVAERWELLRGLMDTDGWADKDGDIYFSTVGERLRDDVASLARSLGAVVTIRAKATTYTHNGETAAGQRAYTLRIKLREPALAFGLERKRAKCARRPQSMHKAIVSIEPSRMAVAQCIRVSHPAGLYLTDDYTVTHNTDGLLGDFIGFSIFIGQAKRGEVKWPGVRLLPNAHARGLFVRRTYDELDEAVARSHELLEPLGAVWRPSKYTWTLPWGGFLKMRYLQRDADASRYQGHSYNYLAVDEAGNFASPDPIKKLTATLRDRNGVPVRKRMSANPGGPGHGWLKTDYVDPAAPFVPHADPDTGMLRVYIPSRLTDNLALQANDPLYATRLRGSGPAWLVQAWLNGDWNAAPEGGIFRAVWLRNHYTQLPEAPEAFLRVHSWDTAYKPEQHNDPSVLTDWTAATANAKKPPGFYLRNVFRERMTYPDLKRKVMEFAERDSPDAILIEDKASGQSLLQELRDTTTLPVIAIEPDGDKVTRALRVTPLMESGRVFMPERAPWLLDYELELTLFPTKGVHDDQVDSTTQALDWMRLHAGRGFKHVSSGQKRQADQAPGGGRTTVDSTGWGTVSGGTDTTGFM